MTRRTPHKCAALLAGYLQCCAAQDPQEGGSAYCPPGEPSSIVGASVGGSGALGAAGTGDIV